MCISYWSRRHACSSGCRPCRCMRTCSRPACATAKASSTTASSSTKSAGAGMFLDTPRLLWSSWPGLARPSTSWSRREDVDARDKRGHDDAAGGRADEVAMSNGGARYSRVGKIATVIFDRPAAHNAMIWKMYEQLDVACARIRAEHDVRVAVFRGAGGKAFIAGTDIAQFQQFRSAEDGLAYEEKMESYIDAVESLPVPTLAVIEGYAIGG